MKLNYSKKILGLSLIVLIGVVVLNIIFTNLLLDKIISINDKIKQLDISSREREKELNLKDAVASSKSDRENLTGYFVGAGDAQTVEFTKSLESLAKANGVTYSIKSLNYEPVSDLGASGVVLFIRFNFDIFGKWSNVFSFLQAIENLPKVVAVNSVSFNLNSISGGANKSTDPSWSADLDFSVVKLKN